MLSAFSSIDYYTVGDVKDVIRGWVSWEKRS